MKRSSHNDAIRSHAAALSQHMKASELKKLASLTGARLPTRKEELVEVIVAHLAGNRLRTVFESLDELQKAAVAEVVHSDDTFFAADRSAMMKASESPTNATSSAFCSSTRRRPG